MTGSVRETYHAALQHNLVDLPPDTRLVGVVRRPLRWFTQIDENRPELGPPTDLLEETKAKAEYLKLRGMCNEEAHNAAWEETDFEARYREYIESSPEAQQSLSALAERIDRGETVTLVCYEGKSKRCHRRILTELLEERVDA